MSDQISFQKFVEVKKRTEEDIRRTVNIHLRRFIEATGVVPDEVSISLLLRFSGEKPDPSDIFISNVNLEISL